MQTGSRNEDDCFVVEEITVSDSDDEPEFCGKYAVMLNDDFCESPPAKGFSANEGVGNSSTLEEDCDDEMEPSNVDVGLDRCPAVESSESSGDELFSGKNGNTKGIKKARRRVPKIRVKCSRIKQEVKTELNNSEKMRLKIEKVETLKRDGSSAEIRQQPSVAAANPVASDSVGGGQCTGYVLVPIQMPFPMMAFGGMMPMFAGGQMPFGGMMAPQTLMAAQSFMGMQTMLAPSQSSTVLQEPVQPAVLPTAVQTPVPEPPAEPAVAAATADGFDKPPANDSSAVECVLTTDEDLTDWKLCATTVVNLCEKNDSRCAPDAANSDLLNDTDAHFQDCDDGFVYESDANSSPRRANSSSHKKHAFNKPYPCTNCGKKFIYAFSPRRRIELALGRHYCEKCVGKMAEPVGSVTALRSGKKLVDGLGRDKLLRSTGTVGSCKPVFRLKQGSVSDKMNINEVRVKLEKLDDVETVEKSCKSRATRSTDGLKPFQTEIFSCEHCDKKFSRPVLLYKHCRKHHFAKTPVVCHSCHKQFENLMVLKAHKCSKKPSHSNSPKSARSVDESKQKCGVCGRFFRKLRSFSGEKQFRCLKCRQNGSEQSPTSKNSAETNTAKSSAKSVAATPMNKTPVIMPFKCDKCFETFKLRYHLAKHRKSVHPKKSK